MNSAEATNHPTAHVLSMPLPSEQIHAFKENRARLQRYLMVPLIIFVLNTIMIFTIALRDALVAAKILLIEVMVVSALISLVIVLASRQIKHGLSQAEEIAHFASDQAFVELNTARETLAQIRRKLSREEQELASGAIPELLKTVGPFVMLFIQKEKSIFKWGMLGMKIAQNAMALMKERAKHS